MKVENLAELKVDRDYGENSVWHYPNLLWRLRALLGLVLVVVSVPTYGTLLLLAIFAGIPRKTQTFFIRKWFSFVSWSLGVKYEVQGVENFNPKVPALVVSNHQSLLDIPAAFFALPNCDLRMVAKRELFQIPFFGWCLARMEFIPIDRGNRQSGRSAADKISQQIKSGIQVWVAPEGTRSSGTEMGPFKKGSFAVAIESKIPIQPILVVNSYEALPKKSLIVRPGTCIRIQVLKPVSTEGVSIENRGKLAEQIREILMAALAHQEISKES